MEKLMGRIRPECRQKRLVMVLDNLAAHKGRPSLDAMEEFCEPFFMPPYSCELNCQETVWSMLKSRVLKEFTKMQVRYRCDRAACIQAVKDEITRIDPAAFVNITRAHFGYIQKLLGKVADEFWQVNDPRR
jgi:transposase